jgi:RNA polymerase sigma-70 factor, ECF subfamily
MAEPGEPVPKKGESEARAASLVAAFCDGESEAVREIEGWVRRSASPFREPLGSDWDDVVQVSLLKLWTALRQGRFASEASLGAYVKRVVANACLDRLRSRRLRQWVPLDELALPASCSSALERLARRESAAVLLVVLAEMPAECRDLWQMILDGLSYREMSDRLGVAEGALRARVLRCRRRAAELRRELAARGARRSG